MRNKIEDNPQLCTKKEFHDAMQKEEDDAYSSKMTKIKLKEKYGDSVQLVGREERSDSIFSDYISSNLVKSWYDQQKSD